jgi:YHS domain-containing protein
MRKSVHGIITSIVLVTGAAVMLAAAEPASKAQTACPVTGKAIDKSIHVDFQGQRVYFCSAACPAGFRKDPEKYFATIADTRVELENIQTTCPVSGEALEGGDMGGPVSHTYKGRTVMFCCKMCVGKFEKDPARYLAKLPGEQPPTAN